METLNNKTNEISEKLLQLTKENNSEALISYIDSLDDKDALSALMFLKNENNEKTDLLCAEFLASGKGCEKSETEAGNLCAKIVTYLEKRNDFPIEYGKACFMAASLLYDKTSAFELNLGFAIDYDRRGAENGRNEDCKKRYETNIEFLKSLTPRKYENEEMLYKTAAFVLNENDKKQLSDNYWGVLKEEALKTEKAYLLKYFSEEMKELTQTELNAVDEILERNKNFPQDELYQKEQAKKSRPSLSVYGTTKTDIFSRISVGYNEFEDALESLKKTRVATERKAQHKEKLGIKSYDFWCDEEKIKRALEIYRRKETYESVFGIQSPDFWENDTIFFKHMDAYSLKEKYKDVLGENNWDFWLDKEKVLSKINEKKTIKKIKKEKSTKSGKLLILVLIFAVFFGILLITIKSITGLSIILASVISAILSFVLTLLVGRAITSKAKKRT